MSGSGLVSWLGVVSDRGSRYAVSGAPARTRDEVEAVLGELKRGKKFARATHNSWACLSRAEGPLKNDDGEAGAAQIMLDMLTREGIEDEVVIVTRWYGGKHLGGDRFRHVITCMRHWIAHRPADRGTDGPGTDKRRQA